MSFVYQFYWQIENEKIIIWLAYCFLLFIPYHWIFVRYKKMPFHRFYLECFSDLPCDSAYTVERIINILDLHLNIWKCWVWCSDLWPNRTARGNTTERRKGYLFGGLEPHSFCYPGRCSKPVRLVETSPLRFTAGGNHYGRNKKLD